MGMVPAGLPVDDDGPLRHLDVDGAPLDIAFPPVVLQCFDRYPAGRDTVMKFFELLDQLADVCFHMRRRFNTAKGHLRLHLHGLCPHWNDGVVIVGQSRWTFIDEGQPVCAASAQSGPDRRVRNSGSASPLRAPHVAGLWQRRWYALGRGPGEIKMTSRNSAFRKAVKNIVIKLTFWWVLSFLQFLWPLFGTSIGNLEGQPQCH